MIRTFECISISELNLKKSNKDLHFLTESRQNELSEKSDTMSAPVLKKTLFHA